VKHNYARLVAIFCDGYLLDLSAVMNDPTGSSASFGSEEKGFRLPKISMVMDTSNIKELQRMNWSRTAKKNMGNVKRAIPCAWRQVRADLWPKAIWRQAVLAFGLGTIASILPVIVGVFSLTWSNSSGICRPDGKFLVPELDTTLGNASYNPWAISSLFDLSLVGARDLSFPIAKLIDVCWDLVSPPSSVALAWLHHQCPAPWDARPAPLVGW